MTTATATLWGSYKYSFEMPKNPTLHNVAWAIALAVHKAEGKTKFTGQPRSYNYIIESLRQHEGTFNYLRYNADSGKKDEIYAAANELQNESKFYKIKCPEHTGYGCAACNGHGYLWERIGYRVGNTFSHRVVIDIDEHDRINMMHVKTFYEAVLHEKFKVYETNGGYWLIGNKEYDKTAFVFTHCKLLFPGLKINDLQEYRKNLLKLDVKKGNEFIPATPEMIRASPLYKAPVSLSFDLAFTFLSIKREQSTLRESAKHEGDRIVEVIL